MPLQKKCLIGVIDYCGKQKRKTLSAKFSFFQFQGPSQLSLGIRLPRLEQTANPFYKAYIIKQKKEYQHLKNLCENIDAE